MSVYGYGEPLDPYSPIQNEPMGRDYSPDNFNSSNPKVRSNYKYKPLSTYNLDTDAIYSNHMYGGMDPRWSATDARYPPFQPNPARNSWNVEKGFNKNSVDFQSPDFVSSNGQYTPSTKGKKERLENLPGACGCAVCRNTHIGSGHSLTLFLVFLIIVLVIFAYTQLKQNKEMVKMIRDLVAHARDTGHA